MADDSARTHGTPEAYADGCRCVDCRFGNSLALVAERRRLRAAGLPSQTRQNDPPPPTDEPLLGRTKNYTATRKRCGTCKEWLPHDQFRRDSSKPPPHLAASCRLCVRAQNHGKKKPRNAEVARRAGLKYRHSITVEDYERMLAEQGHSCAICGRTNAGGSHGTFCVDHDHGCCPGRRGCGNCIRGLLCVRCNRLSAWSKDRSVVACWRTSASSMVGLHPGRKPPDR